MRKEKILIKEAWKKEIKCNHHIMEITFFKWLFSSEQQGLYIPDHVSDLIVQVNSKNFTEWVQPIFYSSLTSDLLVLFTSSVPWFLHLRKRDNAFWACRDVKRANYVGVYRTLNSFEEYCYGSIKYCSSCQYVIWSGCFLLSAIYELVYSCDWQPIKILTVWHLLSSLWQMYLYFFKQIFPKPAEHFNMWEVPLAWIGRLMS